MKIENIHIKNFRSLYDLEFQPRDIFAFVGKNNSGKSNILKALNLFFNSSKKLLDKDCFFNYNLDDPIEISIKFKDLNDYEKDKFNYYLKYEKINGELIEKLKIKRTYHYIEEEDDYDINRIATKSVPDYEWLQTNKIKAKIRDKWWKRKDELVIEDENFFDYFDEFKGKPNVSTWKKAIKLFIKDNKDIINFKDQEFKNPQGLSSVLKSNLPELILIPAVKDISDEAKVSKYNPFGKLINSILNKIPSEKKEIVDKKIEELNSLLNIKENEDSERLSAIEKIEQNLNKYVKELMECKIELEMEVPNIKDIFSNTKIFADDGVRTSIETKGHGLQRSMIVSILRAYSELLMKNEEEKDRNILFLIEEPELYLHPQAQKTFLKVLHTIAKSGDQVFYSTHSNLLVDIIKFDEVGIVKKKENKSQIFQLTMDKMIKDFNNRHENIDPNEIGMRELYKNVFDPIANEGFFADKIVLVEGSTELYTFPIFAELLNYDLDKNNVALIPTNGKGSMDRFLRIFNGFKLPTYIIFDGDKNNDSDKMKEKTIELLNMCGEEVENINEVSTKINDIYAVFENNYESVVEDNIEKYDEWIEEGKNKLGKIGKPLKQKYIAYKIEEKIDDNNCDPKEVIPQPFVNIIDKIKNVEYPGSLL
ncbi:MAG: AAA family ATPase, partial [Candidatus Mcinerneyibacterium aminivorans]